MQNLWKGIAVAGIWIGVGISAKYTGFGVWVVAICATIATHFVCEKPE